MAAMPAHGSHSPDNELPRKQTPLAGKLKRWAAIVAAAAGLFVAVDDAVWQVGSSHIGHGVMAKIWSVAMRRAASQTTAFRLTVSGEPFADDPTDLAVVGAVHEAERHAEGPFVILDRSRNEFIQAAFSAGDLWDLEYRSHDLENPEGSPVLFRCQASAKTDTVVRALQLYHAGDDRWTKLCKWERAD